MKNKRGNMLTRSTKHLRRIAAFALLLPVFAYVVLWLAVYLMPLPKEDVPGRPKESWRILDRQGRVLREVVNPGGFRHQWTALPDISPFLIDAVLAVEDAGFYSHDGVDWTAALRASWQNARAGRVVSGASTISMQLARLLYGYPRNFDGKLRQAFNALRLEQTFEKGEILECYLNLAPYGMGCIGIESASRRYYGKSNRHLSLAEAALLAGLLKAPGKLAPLQHFRQARQRQRIVLRRMLETGTIDRADYERALREPLQFQKAPSQPEAMHFSEYIMSLSPEPGELRTTLNADLQQQLERLVNDHVEALRFGGLTNAAVVVLDNRDGGILAMVGSRDYWDADGGAVNGALAKRQPGSTLKPFTYALAFERGFSPASVIPDIESYYLGAAGTLFIPTNYSEQFYGPVLMAEALGRSLNVPALRTLDVVGVKSLLTRLQAIGFQSLQQSAWYYGLGLTLGNGEVTLLELAQGYAMLARGGRTCTARAILDIPSEEPRRVFSEEVCFLITDILSDERVRIRAFGPTNPLLLGFPMAVKTGTSANWRDNWVVGYTSEYTVAVWGGDFSGKPMDRMSGAVGAGPLFQKIARLLHQRSFLQRQSVFMPPEGVEYVELCSLSGLLPTEACPHRRLMAVQKDRVPEQFCDLHTLLRIDRRNGLLASEQCPAQFTEERVFEVLPPLYTEWQADSGKLPPPAQFSPFCPKDGPVAHALVIKNPRPDDIYLIELGYDRHTQTLELRGEVNPVLPEIEWFLDGSRLASVGWPYEINWQLSRGRHRLEMVAGDRRSEPVEFEVR